MPESHALPKSSSPRRSGDLFGRVAAILDLARSNVVRAVNTNMVTAYWLIGREIVFALQGGKKRAGYGDKIIADLSARLTEKYGTGFSAANLKNFRQFYQSYSDRCVHIGFPTGSQSETAPAEPPRRNSLIVRKKSYPMGSESTTAFSPRLSWSHYRALMRVEDPAIRDFYEQEAIAGGWDKRTLERQIRTFYYERVHKSRNPEKMLRDGRNLPVPANVSFDELRNPYVLEFLDLPDFPELHESNLERAIITHLQRFLLELGNGFAFVARQKHVRIGEQDRYIDLVFYHCRLKFYLLIDLKVDELTHADVGQMDGYVRMYDELYVASDDNPTIGLILCTEKNETVVRYSVLKDRKQIFASRYMLFLPTEEQLRAEIEKERRLIEASLGE